VSPDYTALELAEWSAGDWYPAAPSAVSGVSHDTRALAAGDVYIAIRGDNHDGHRFVNDAFRAGASGAVVATDAGLTPSAECPLMVVEDPARALREMAAAYRLKVNPHIVSVTGSVGKSTVKEMTAQVLATAATTPRTKGNWNNDIGLPLSLLAMPGDARWGVFEVGMNHPGEITPLCRILKPNWGIVTNIGPVHMEFFRSIDDIAAEKSCLLASLPPDGVAFLNRDEPFFDLLVRACPGPIVTISATGNADYVCTGRNPATGEATILEADSGEERRVVLPSLSDYNILNALFAMAVARSLQIGWGGIQAAFDHYQPLPMRWQELTVGGLRVVNDAYNANPVSMRASIRAFAEYGDTGAKWLVLAGMKELGAIEKEQHLELGSFLAQGNWAGLIAVGALGELIADGAEADGFAGTVVRVADAERAAHELVSCAAEGDAVLLKASRGMHLEKVVTELENTQGE
jgi:UDP-N-acetylmuramoyl-tripeptide--D-alanyl-D-alanine ligase